DRFKQKITETLATGEDKTFFAEIVESYSIEHGVPPVEIAVALASMAQGDSPLVIEKNDARLEFNDGGGDRDRRGRGDRKERGDRGDRGGRERGERGDRGGRERGERGGRSDRGDRKDRTKTSEPVTQGMERFHISVGKAHGVKPASIVQAISDVAGLTDKDIGRIELHDRFSFVELPFGMPKEVFNDLKNTKVSGEKLAISIVKESSSKPKFSKSKAKGGKKKY
ncbi:MAG: DbpA RNA binding domain-containing protein, partial [Phycisphaerales bacterium]